MGVAVFRSSRFVTYALVTVIVLVAAAGYLQHRHNQRLVDERLTGLADTTARDIRSRIALYEYGLRSARAVAMMLGRQGLNRQRFSRYIEARELGREFPGAKGFGLIQRVADGDLERFVQLARADGAPNFSIRELQPNDGEHFIIVYIEPVAPNRQAVGLDIASERNRRDAALAAMRTGKATLTGPITLVQATGKPLRSMLFLLPVYDEDADQAHARHDDHVGGEHQGWGWVYAPLVTDEILASFGDADRMTGLSLWDVTDSEPTQIYASDDVVQASSEHLPTRTLTFEMFGRQWQAAVSATPRLVRSMRLMPPWLTGALVGIGGLVVLLIAQMLLALRERNRRVRESRSRLAAIAEASRDAIILVDHHGKVIEWNGGASRLFGYRQDEARGTQVSLLVCPPEHAAEDARLLARAVQGTASYDLETERWRKDHSRVAVEWSMVPLATGSGVAIIARDISERVAFQDKLLALNHSLESQVQQRTDEILGYAATQTALVEGVGYAIVLVDPDGRIQIFNGAAEKLFGYRRQQLLGTQGDICFLHGDELPAEAQGDSGGSPQLSASCAEVEDGEWLAATRDGDFVPVLVRSSRVIGRDGADVGRAVVVVDLRERRAREQALQLSEAKLRGLFELSPLGIALVDAEGQFVDYNDAFVRIIGYPRDQLQRMNFHAITPEEFHASDAEQLERVTREGVYGPYEKEYLRPDGSRVPVRLNGIRLEVDGRPMVWSIFEDITGQRETQRVLKAAASEADEASRAKTNFLANMSHEIRTPMNAVIGMLQLLDLTRLDTQQKDYLAKAELGAHALLDIINDILDFSKIEAGHQQLDLAEFSLDTLVGELAVMGAGNLGEKDVEFVVNVDPTLPHALVGDAKRLLQVMTNLVGNAVKFTEHGEVVLCLRAERAAATDVTIRFEVRDSGVGIPADALPHIFDRFNQADASTARKFGGTGLGLAISSRLVTMMGGQLNVESEFGKGSCFHFTATLGVGQKSGGYPVPEVLKGIRVLVADDNDSTRDAVLGMAQALGWDADGVDSVPATTAHVLGAADAGRGYDALFLDWHMHGSSGETLVARLRKELGSPLSIIAMTSLRERESVAAHRGDEARRPDGFIIKPVTARQMVGALAGLHGADDADAHPAQPSTGLAGLRILVVEDNVANQQVAVALIRAQGGDVVVASGGREALRMLAETEAGFDVVLMDIQMPEMDGYTATRAIRERLAQEVPVIAMTANVLGDVRHRCLEAGMQGFIGKPFAIADLVGTVRRVCGLAVATPGSVMASESGGGPPPARTDEGLNWRGALERFGGEIKAFVSTLTIFPRSLAESEANLRDAIAIGETEVIIRELHTLKSVSATFGAETLSKMAARLEQGVVQGNLDLAAEADAVEALFAQMHHDARAADALGHELARGGRSSAPAMLNPGDLDQLISLLRQSNLKAVSVFRALPPELCNVAPDVFVRLREAMAALDFDAAIACCNELKAAADTE